MRLLGRAGSYIGSAIVGKHGAIEFPHAPPVRTAAAGERGAAARARRKQSPRGRSSALRTPRRLPGNCGCRRQPISVSCYCSPNTEVIDLYLAHNYKPISTVSVASVELVGMYQYQKYNSKYLVGVLEFIKYNFEVLA